MMHSGPFSERLRLRVCGLLVDEERILLVKLRSPVTEQLVWMPPGGEVEFGESLHEALQREFPEETGVEVEVSRLLHIEELIERPFHAVECYFEVRQTGGEPAIGFDPELKKDEQLLSDIAWIPLAEVDRQSFAPRGLLPKLNNWEDRVSFQPML